MKPILPCLLLLVWDMGHSAIVTRPLIGNFEEYLYIRSVQVSGTNYGGREVTVTFDTSGSPSVLWEVGRRPVLNYDPHYVTMSSYTSATLRLRSADFDKDVKVSLVLRVFQASLWIGANVAMGTYPIANHTFDVSPSEGMAYSGDEVNHLDVDAALWRSNTSMLRRPVVSAMAIMPDYCSQPIRTVFGFQGNNMLETQTPGDDDVVFGRTDWREAYPSSQATVKKTRIVAVQQPSQSQGMLVLNAQLQAYSGNSAIANLHISRRVFFRPGADFQNFLRPNTVTLIGWKHELTVDEHEDIDMHVYAIGNPTPRISLAKNGRDASSIVARMDIEEEYYKHVIIRFRDATKATSGRYICTVVSGSGRLKETVTLYVRMPCTNP